MRESSKINRLDHEIDSGKCENRFRPLTNFMVVINIRQAEMADLAAIKACAVAAYQVYVEPIGCEPAPMVADFAERIERETLFVAEWQKKFCGFIVFYPKRNRMHLENVAVRPDCQRQGVGSRLIDYAERQARSGGYRQIELYTNALMTENLKIYPGLGYRQFDRRTEDGFDRVYFEKNL